MTSLGSLHTKVAMFLLMMLLSPLLTSPAMGTSTDIVVGVRHNMRAILVTPDGAGPYPGVLILHTSHGLESTDIDYASRLSQEGYVCLVPAYTEAYGITGSTQRDTFIRYAEPIYVDLVDAVAVLRHTDKVGGSKVGAMGFSKGGYFAMWLAATKKVEAGVSYYGALTGEHGSDRDLGRFRAAFTAESAPVLVLHGTADDDVPVEAAQRLDAILRTAQSPHELHLYLGAGHRFDRNLTSGANRAAATDAWQRTLASLGKYLK